MGLRPSAVTVKISKRVFFAMRRFKSFPPVKLPAIKRCEKTLQQTHCSWIYYAFYVYCFSLCKPNIESSWLVDNFAQAETRRHELCHKKSTQRKKSYPRKQTFQKKCITYDQISQCFESFLTKMFISILTHRLYID